MAWKEIVLYVADGDQTISLSIEPGGEGLKMTSKEVFDKDKSFLTYLSLEDAVHLGEELIKFTDEIKADNK